jgi:hypothetical protein
VAVDAVLGDQQRDAQPRTLDQLVRFDHSLGRRVQDRADVQVLDDVAHTVPCRQLQHLTHLLGQRHAGDQVGDPVRDRQCRVEVGRGCWHGVSSRDRSGRSALVGFGT